MRRIARRVAIRSSGCRRRLRGSRARRRSTASNIARMRASDAGLSTTTTSSGLFDEARTRPHVPSSTVTRTPLTVTRSRIGCPANGSPRACIAWSRATTRSATSYLTSSAQCGRHRRRAPGLRQLAIEIGHRLSRIAVEHVEDGDRGDEAVVIAAPDRRVEEEVARLLEAGERVQIPDPPLDVRMAGLPEIDLDAVGAKLGIGREQAGRLDVDDEGRALVQRRQVARQHDPDLVGENLLALVVDHAAAVAVAVEAEREVGAGSPSPPPPSRAASAYPRGSDCSAGR